MRLILLVSLMLAVAGCCAEEPAGTAAASKARLIDPVSVQSNAKPLPSEAEMNRITVTETGTLQGGMMAIGGETTGWMLKTDQGSIMVDVSALPDKATSSDGQRVAITGVMKTVDYVESGPTPVLVAEAITPAR